MNRNNHYFTTITDTLEQHEISMYNVKSVKNQTNNYYSIA
ncbi:hypothetical protein B4102_0067 [Heyndrickxia sporothermodurans]|uniref:Uncharacterized protein n=1 Tax=Heyndrickxia sporothermodurans TaxID=46224 RepID=A0A150LF87_9BACI|nr:hypothetical protein B4102_0067 [Heyndrickxia sporothermodurans]